MKPFGVAARVGAGLLLGAGAGLAWAPATAAIYSFSGTRANVNSLNPPGTGRCAPLNTVNIAPGALSSTGTSNFGDFASTQSHCIAGAPTMAIPVRDVTDGIFSYDFVAGDTLFGTYSGTASLISGIIYGVENFTVTGGTGRFQDASGTFTTNGILSFIPNPQGPGFVGNFSGSLAGTLNLPAIPEPDSWMTMILGFGFLGGAARRRRRALVAG